MLPFFKGVRFSDVSRNKQSRIGKEALFGRPAADGINAAGGRGPRCLLDNMGERAGEFVGIVGKTFTC